MVERLYIDGEPLDMEADTGGVQMIYQSPLLTDLRDIVSNRTTSITVPLSAHNAKVVGYAGTQARSLFPYRRHRAVYERDGLQVFTGTAVLLSVGKDTMTLFCVWGNTSAFQQLFDIGLRELGGDQEEYVRLVPDTFIPYRNRPARMSFGYAGRKMPAVLVKDILSKIEAKTGISGLSDVTEWHQYAVQLTTMQGDVETRRRQALKLGTPALHTISVAGALAEMAALVKGAGATDPNSYEDQYGRIDTQGAMTARIKLDGSFTMLCLPTQAAVLPIALYLVPYVGDWDISARVQLSIPTQNPDTQGYQSYTFHSFEKDVDVSHMEAFALVVLIDAGVTASLENIQVTELSVTMDPDTEQEYVYGSGLTAYPLYRNLPDISCGQFIRNLMLLHGMFAYSVSGSEIRFTSFAELLANRSRAWDWTYRVDMQDGRCEERRTVLDGFASRNWLRYKEAEGITPGSLDGYITVDDETLENERTAFESDFSPAPGNKVPVWTEDGEYQGEGLTPRLLVDTVGRVSPDDARYMGYLTSQNWAEIIRTRYGSYSDVVRHPVVIKTDVVIRPADLLRLDMRVPVYLSQTGRYYAIRTLTVKDGEKAEAELIEL